MRRTICAAAFVLLLLPGPPALPEELSGPEISFPAIKEYLDTGKRSPGLLEELKLIQQKSRSSPEYRALDGLLNRAGQKGRFQFMELLQREGLIGPVVSPEVLPAIGRVIIHSVEVVDRRATTDEPLSREPPRQQLKVSFGVEGDLFGYLRYHGYTLATIFAVCKGPGGGSNTLVRHPYVYDDNGIVNSFRTDIANGTRQPPGRVFRAYVYMQHERNDEIPPYDLWREPKDVCLQLTGGNGLGGSFTTELLYISERTISEAIATRAHLP
jgi:hypothetical protein